MLLWICHFWIFSVFLGWNERWTLELQIKLQNVVASRVDCALISYSFHFISLICMKERRKPIQNALHKWKLNSLHLFTYFAVFFRIEVLWSACASNGHFSVCFSLLECEMWCDGGRPKLHFKWPLNQIENPMKWKNCMKLAREYAWHMAHSNHSSQVEDHPERLSGGAWFP